MFVSLGRCHFGGDDAATTTAVRVSGTGWIAVCERHRERAEAEGFTVRAPTPVGDAVPPLSRDRESDAVQPEEEPVHDRRPGAAAEAPPERRVVVGASSVGCCHYGCAVATMTGTRPGSTGWIAVCLDHRARAEEDGYDVREIAGVTVAPPTYDQASGTEGDAGTPIVSLPALVETLRRAVETGTEAAEDDSGLDIFEATLDGP